MRHTIPVVLLAAASLLIAGCFPLSSRALYTGEGDVIYDPALLGRWHSENEPENRWEFEPVETGDAYIVRGRQDETVAQFRGVLVRVGDRRFLDLYPIGHEPEINESFAGHMLRMHSIWRVGIEEDRLRFALPDLKMVAELLDEQPDLIAHTTVPLDPDGSGDDDEWLVITADSAAFQAFVRDHLDDSYFKNEIVLVKPAE